MKNMKRYDATAPCFRRTGRQDGQADACGLWWSGSALTMRVQCTEIEVEAESTAVNHAQFLGVMIDGAPVCRFPLREGAHRYPALRGLDGTVFHEVAILRDTQPSYDESGPVILHAVYTDGEIEQPKEKPFLLEFIGDSLTVGEGTLGPQSGQEWIMPYISHMPAFPALVSAALDAEERVVALGGWGAYKSWDGRHESRIGAIYEQLCAVVPGGERRYDFHEREADAVVINLGTNDGSALKAVPKDARAREEEAFMADAAALIGLVRRHQPRARILWAYGLCGEEMAACIQKAVDGARAAGDGNVSYLPLPPAQDVGSRMHPSRRAHERAAEVIAGALREILQGEADA